MEAKKKPGGVAASSGQGKDGIVSSNSNTSNTKNKYKYDTQSIVRILKDRIPSIPSCVPNLRKESENSLCGPCPNCGGVDRFVYRQDKEAAQCRNCHKEWADQIEFQKWTNGKSFTDLVKEFIPEYQNQEFEPNPIINNPEIQRIWDDAVIQYTNEKPVLDLLCGRRKLSKKPIKKIFNAEGVRFKPHCGKNAVIVPFKTLQGDLAAIQALSVDGEPFPFTVKNGNPANKVFLAGSLPGKDCFFIVGIDISEAKLIIICESVINALTAHECFPDACCIALGGTTYASKVIALKPYINDTAMVVVCVDNDSPSEKMLRNLWDILQIQIFSFKWSPDDPRGYDINDALQEGEKKRIIDLIQNAVAVWYEIKTTDKKNTPDAEAWDAVEKRFPKTAFPWDVFPAQLASSLRQLGRSCATSPTHLPGIACAILAAALGRHIEVMVKSSWVEPLIFWMMSLLSSGEGKTPAQNALNLPIYEEQARLDATHKNELEQWDALPANVQKETPKPNSPGGIFTTDMTVESLRMDQRLCGGLIIVNDEASGFFDGQNQYKNKKGTDRQAYLKLYDGNPARIIRSSGAFFIKGLRVNIAGGTQPEVFMRIFKPTDPNDDGNIFLVDGTFFRFMMTWEGEKFFPMVLEPWDENNQKVWSLLIKNALSFCHEREESLRDGEELKSHRLYFSDDALHFFIDWANDIRSIKSQFPEQTRGFISKLIGWAVRLTGIIRCFESFIKGTRINQILETEDLQKGIKLAEFYMSHNVDITKAIVSSAFPAKSNFTEQEIHLADVLQGLKNQIDSGRLAIGFIWEKYNESCSPEIQFKTARAMGALLRSCKLTVSGGKHDANGKRAVNCLEWDKLTESFIETCLQEKQSLQNHDHKEFQDADIMSARPTMSANILDEAVI